MSDASRAGYRLLPPDVAIITNIQHCNTDNLNLCSPNLGVFATPIQTPFT